MRLRNHIISIILSLLALTVPILFKLNSGDIFSSNLWSLIAYVGVVTSPGLAFALFLRKWVKNVSDDMTFSVSIFFSILWVLFLYTWQSNQGLPISHMEILWSTVGVAAVFTVLGNLPNGKKLTASEPLKNKLPMFFSVLATLPIVLALLQPWNLIDTDLDDKAKYNVIYVLSQTPESISVRVNNPSAETSRLTVNLLEEGTNGAPFVFTDLVSSGATDVTFTLPPAETGECVRYAISYTLINSEQSYESSPMVIGNGYCKPETTRKPALPTNREELLNYLFSEGLK